MGDLREESTRRKSMSEGYYAKSSLLPLMLKWTRLKKCAGTVGAYVGCMAQCMLPQLEVSSHPNGTQH